jgi:hypothetical protein
MKKNSDISRLARLSSNKAASYIASDDAEFWENEEIDFLFSLGRRVKREIGDSFVDCH